MKKICILFCFLFITFFMAAQDSAATASNIRFGGMNRYETSVNVSKSNFEKSEYVVLVSGENFSRCYFCSTSCKKI
ncbi:hypothetical protein ACI7YW_09660 [Clostridium ljungdahlii]|uniref:cell wall-binding repeat-containing protein n=1 Tax=Clostridium ljungdahlii TaxID=1538 RepID=UPI00386BA400